MPRLGLAMLVLLLAACGTEEPGTTTPDLEGALGGDAQLEGGCAWLDADGTRYEVLWPDGYRVEFEPVRLVGPDGGVVAEEADTVAVSGRVAEDMASICMVGTIFEADAVLEPGKPSP